MLENEIPYGYCHCGCGQKTNIITKNHTKPYRKKGEPALFLRGHGGHGYRPSDEPNPSGLCMCGCGGKTELAAQSNTKRGLVKGKPVQYIRGHQSKGVSPESRFWEKVDKRGPDDCWLWTGSLYEGGYGQFSIGTRKLVAHRFSYELHYGEVPEGLFALHKCDVRACVNPNHLWAGTKKENSVDMVNKGRCLAPYGEKAAKAKLTESQVIEIRELYASGKANMPELARVFNVHHSTIQNIIVLKSWKHI